jgi:hypothetical protein
MKPINVNRKNLVSKLIANREVHISNYKKAIRGYYEERNRIIREMYHKVMENEGFSHNEMLADLEKPISHEEDYNTYIEMYSNSVDETIELTEGEFRMLFLDKWNWNHSFTSTVTKYVK